MASVRCFLPRCYAKYVLFCSKNQTSAGAVNLLRRCSQDTKKTSTGFAPVKPSSSSAEKEEYKVPEYYQHDEFSFLDIQIAMSKYRIPQPSSKTQSTK